MRGSSPQISARQHSFNFRRNVATVVRRRGHCVWLVSLKVELGMRINGVGIELQAFRSYSNIVTTTSTGRLLILLNKINEIHPNMMVIVQCCNPRIPPLKLPGSGLVKLDENFGVGISRKPNSNRNLMPERAAKFLVYYVKTNSSSHYRKPAIIKLL